MRLRRRRRRRRSRRKEEEEVEEVDIIKCRASKEQLLFVLFADKYTNRYRDMFTY